MVTRPTKHAAISASSSGDNTIVAAVTGKKIRVLSYVLIADSNVDVRFEDGASGTALTGQMEVGTATDSGGLVVGHSPVGHFETSASTLLNLELSGAVQVSGHLVYEEV